MKKIILVVIVGIFLISLVSAEQQTLGTFKQGSTGDCITLIQTCGNCSYNNISTVLKTGEDSEVFTINSAMTQDNTYYNYSFCNITNLGIYNVHGFGNPNGVKTSWVYEFEITGTGFDLDVPRTNLSIALLFLIVFAFVICIFGVTKLPSTDNFEDGKLISVSKLKYLRPVLGGVSWFLLIAIFYTGSNIALAYMGTTLLGNILFVLFRIMFLLTLPMIVVWFLYIFVSVFQDRKLEKNILRGFE